MTSPVTRRRLVRSLCFVIGLTLAFVQGERSHGLTINPQNVQAMAIYGTASGVVQTGLTPAQIVFNVTSPSVIASLISAIEFSVERDCSAMGALIDAVVYVRFNDGAIEIYELFSTWYHFSKLGFRQSCYYVAPSAHSLFQSNAQ